MWRAIFQRLGRALFSVFGTAQGFVLGAVQLPFRILGSRTQPPARRPDLAALQQRFAGHGLKPVEIVQSQKRDSQIAYSWIVGCTLDAAASPFPSAMSKTMAEWLRGLDYQQLLALRNAGAAGIFAHVTAARLLDSVPRHQPLPAVTLLFPPPPIGQDGAVPALVTC